ncbi:hypothetical protein VPIG_00138 [Vibrio phage PWH3a-P1]|uniref:hypothetical protein n=1 Tax=Vibrio phage PWH3a-P1 TaxID=754058 RepID=UPI0002C0681F|nr:hypothetical protein VPIG_00138 [Vibrio phage PWH3a-P1]AGH31995.1 hypothetical protein VPIG_00138 [Vibrio phage PWH3a-P1]
MKYILQHNGSVSTEYAVVVFDSIFEAYDSVASQSLDVSYTDNINDATKFTFIGDAWCILAQIEDDQAIKFNLDEWDVVPFIEEK